MPHEKDQVACAMFDPLHFFLPPSEPLQRETPRAPIHPHFLLRDRVVVYEDMLSPVFVPPATSLDVNKYECVSPEFVEYTSAKIRGLHLTPSITRHSIDWPIDPSLIRKNFAAGIDCRHYVQGSRGTWGDASY